MTSLRKRKLWTCRSLINKCGIPKCAADPWAGLRPVGREFDSPDFECLMEEDYLNRTGVFDPELKKLFPNS